MEELPTPRHDVWPVVPRVVAEACPEHRDLVFPYRREVRDHAGRAMGCAVLGRRAQEGF